LQLPLQDESHPGAQGQLRCPKGRPRAPCKDAVVTWWVGSGRHPRHVRSTYLRANLALHIFQRRRALFHAVLPKPSAWMLLILSQTEQTGASEKRRCGNGTCGLPPRGMPIHLASNRPGGIRPAPRTSTHTHTYIQTSVPFAFPRPLSTKATCTWPRPLPPPNCFSPLRHSTHLEPR
jgi:hypothetical protein